MTIQEAKALLEAVEDKDIYTEILLAIIAELETS